MRIELNKKSDKNNTFKFKKFFVVPFVVFFSFFSVSQSFANEQASILSSIKSSLLSPNPYSFGFDVNPLEQSIDVEIEDIPFSTRRKNNDSFLPLFTETCDNVAYSGVVENQAIAILEDTKDFIEQVTDPIVNISKFEAGIFLYSLGKCFPKVTKSRFSSDCSKTISDGSDTKSVDTGETCFVDQFIDAVSEVDKFFSTTFGMQGAINGSKGATLNTELKTEQSPTVAAKAVENIINDGWFDQTAECVYNEKEKILTKLSSLFERNYKVKTSIIQSVNNTCNISLRKKGDPTTWDEIFEAQAELQGKTKLAIMDLIEESKDASEFNSRLKSSIGVSCVDGFSVTGGCLTREQEKKLERLSEKVEYDSGNYNIRKAYDITRHFFDGDELKSEYATSPVFSSVIATAVPSYCNASGCAPVSINATFSPTTKFEQDYRQLRDTFNINPSTDLGTYLNDIFYDIFPRKAHLKLNNDNDLKGVVLPLQNPFDNELFLIGKPENDRFVVMKTMSNVALTINNLHSKVERGRITDFYRSVVEAFLINADRKSDLAPYKTAFVVSESDFAVFETQIKELATMYSEMGRLVGNKNTISQYSATERANKELAAIQMLGWMKILENVFQTTVQPSIYYEIKDALDYEMISRVKDYTIPLNFNHNLDFVKVRRFFQSLTIKYSENDINNALEVRSSDIQDMVSSNLSEVKLLSMASTPTADEVLDYINRIQKKSNILNARLINYPE